MTNSQDHRGQYVVVARRYRPQGFTDLVGQDMVAQALTNAIETDRVGHAYLFTGARGVGKTSTARILSKALNCERGPAATPCHVCDICQSIASGDDVDVLEIDGASNRGIDEIRQLRSNVGVRPSRSRYKIYIIDEVHMLTKEAFNALLKTLEEPPEHVKFIFCTTDPEKIPITVLSRCQRYDFSPVANGEIVERLKYIVAEEGAEADEEALRLLARKASGSVRDSQSLLEQLLSFTTDRITVDAVHRMLGTADNTRLLAVVSALTARNAAAALQDLDQAVAEGVDAGQLTEQLLGCIRDLLALSVGGGKELMLHSSEADVEQLREVAEQWGTQNLLATAQILDQALARMRLVTHARVLLETALIRIAQLEDLQQLSDLISQLQTDTERATVKKKTPAAVVDSATVRVDRPETPLRQPMETSVSAPAVPVPEPGHPMAGGGTSAATENGVPKQPQDAPGPESEGGGRPEDARGIWEAAIAALDGITADCASQFADVANSAPNRLVVTFPSSYNSSKSFCERPEKHGEIERIVSKVAGRKMKLEFSERADAASEKSARPAISARQREREVAKRPFVQRAAELFSGNITNISQPKRDDQ